MIGIFCKRALLERRYSAKETYNLIDPTDCSHPISVTWLIRMCVMPESYVWHDSFICVPWLIRVRGTYLSHMQCDSFVHAAWFIQICEIPHLHLCLDSSIWVTRLIHMCDIPDSKGQSYPNFFPASRLRFGRWEVTVEWRHICHVTNVTSVNSHVTQQWSESTVSQISLLSNVRSHSSCEETWEIKKTP